jgi:hypothetical protein
MHPLGAVQKLSRSAILAVKRVKFTASALTLYGEVYSDKCALRSVLASLKSPLGNLIWSNDKVADIEIINPCSLVAFCGLGRNQ